jgi:hypothetical protein
MLSARADQTRREAEDQSRWLTDRLRVNARYLAQALSLERELWSTAAQLDREDRQPRLPGFTSILLTPDDGVPDVLDGVAREIIVDCVEEAFERLNMLEELAAEIALVGTPEEALAAREVEESLWEVVGMLEGFAAFDDAADAIQRCRSARDTFAAAARVGLRNPGHVSALDGRPRA